jgi:adenine C2-methylase RlmN of 23S rRNA A2503 and tRNA A37
MGVKRNMTAGEIISQVVIVQRSIRRRDASRDKSGF